MEGELCHGYDWQGNMPHNADPKPCVATGSTNDGEPWVQTGEWYSRCGVIRVRWARFATRCPSAGRPGSSPKRPATSAGLRAPADPCTSTVARTRTGFRSYEREDGSLYIHRFSDGQMVPWYFFYAMSPVFEVGASPQQPPADDETPENEEPVENDETPEPEEPPANEEPPGNDETPEPEEPPADEQVGEHDEVPVTENSSPGVLYDDDTSDDTGDDTDDTPPLTVGFLADTIPAAHAGSGTEFVVRVQFSQAVTTSYRVLRDQALQCRPTAPPNDSAESTSAATSGTSTSSPTRALRWC